MAAKETVIKYAQVKENTNANNRHLTKEKKNDKERKITIK